MEVILLNYSVFNRNQHPLGDTLPRNIRCGISERLTSLFTKDNKKASGHLWTSKRWLLQKENDKNFG
jgi:hypothetical protein